MSASDLFTEASEKFRAGQYDLAQGLLRRLLASHADHAPALHLLGLLAYQSGRGPAAQTLFQRALALDPANAEYYSALGAAQQVVGQAADAVASHRRALELRPGDASLLNNWGISLFASGQEEEAVAAFRQAVTVAPDDAAAWCNLAAALAGQKRYAEAVPLYRRALACNPRLAQAHQNLGNALRAIGQDAEAEACYRQAVFVSPGFAMAHANLGHLLHARGRLAEAVHSYQQALRLVPNEVEIHKRLARIYLDLNQPADAAQHCRLALRLRPSDAEILNDLGNIAITCAALDEALEHYHRAIALTPEWAMPRYNLGVALQAQGRVTEARQCFHEALAIDPKDAVAHSTYLGSLHYNLAVTSEQLLHEHRRWAERHAPIAMTPMHHSNQPQLERRLRIGYVSPDFRSHAVAGFIEPILAHHDPGQVESYGYAEVSAPDAVTGRLRQLCRSWRFTVGLSDEELAALIRQDGIDILVDLAGHTGHNRLLTFARKPAPVQVTYLGYPGTTGLSAIDYRLTDAIADPPEESASHTEELVRLGKGFCCYAPPHEAPEVAPDLPARQNGALTFGSLHKLEKLNDAVLDLWSTVLRDLPDSRLLLARNTLHGSTAEHLLKRFARRGIHSERLLLHQVKAAGLAHLAAYHQIDIALDPFPWNGHTTACEALWMGVPVLTLCGQRHAGRMVASVLTRLELTDLMATTPEDFRRQAVDLAQDDGRRVELRAGLRRRMLDSPLCDAVTFTRHLEAAYRQMWRRWCSQHERA